jgi:hypothetical protein
MLPAVGTKRRGRGEDSIIFDHEGTPCRDSRYHRHCSGRWRGIISKGYWPDGRLAGGRQAVVDHSFSENQATMA